MFSSAELYECDGFNFENVTRNEVLAKSADIVKMKAVKTGTTIAAALFKDGVVLGADTRATEGNIVADKSCFKVHYIADNMYCCGAGTAADLDHVTRLCCSNMSLLRLETGRPVRVINALRFLKQHLFRYQGHVSAYLILGGVDSTGTSLYNVAAHGSSDKLPFVCMGSGSLAAMSVLERDFRPDMSEEEAKALVCQAIRAGIFNDLGSGSDVDLCVIRRDGAEYLRTYDHANVKGERRGKYNFKPGTTPIINQKVVNYSYDVIETSVRPTPMEVA